MSPIKLEFSQDREDNNTATLVLLFKDQECSGLHFTQHLKQKFSAAQQALPYPDIYPHSFRECSSYTMLHKRLFSKRMKNAARQRPSSEHVSNTQMKCRLMNNLQTSEMHKHLQFLYVEETRKEISGLYTFQMRAKSSSWCCMRVLYFTWLTAKSMVSLTFEVSIQHFWKHL